MRASRARRTRGRRRIAVAVLATALVPVGVADLTANEVPMTHAGSSSTPVVITTDLRAVDAAADRLLRARLGTGDGPLVGFAVDFVLPGGDIVCTGVETDREGVARCDASAVAPSAVTWQAEFAGEGALREASDGARMPAMTATATSSDPGAGTDPGTQ